MTDKIKKILSDLTALGYTYILCKEDKITETKEIKEAKYLDMGFYKVNNKEPAYIGQTIKIPKRESNLNVDYFLKKIESKSIYLNFSNCFNILLKKYKNPLNIYPTTYGIGVFIAIGSKEKIEAQIQSVEKLLNDLNIIYKTEYSEAHWVFRYKISKSSINIDKIKQYETNQI